MDKTYDPQKTEGEIYELWEKGGCFTPRIPSRQAPKKKPFTILLPLPNANDPIHMGHVLFTVEDIMIRYHRMLGEPTLWLPGADHAGIETQFVFEKELAKSGKSRFDFDRQTLYQMIVNFVEKNKNINRDQLKRMGFSLDWTRYHYSLEPEIVEKVLETFRKLHANGFVYRAGRVVNYCTHCGTAFSDLEIRYQEQEDSLYYLDYGIIKIATTRPETIFADTAVAVNPKDKRYQKLVGQKAIIPLVNREIPIITDELVEKDFGTGALKITPAHDSTDFEIGQKHHLQSPSVIDIFSGRMVYENIVPEKYQGLSPKKARDLVVTDLEADGKLLKTEPLTHSVGHCYRCGAVIEPLIMPQWYVKTKPLAAPALKAVREGKTKIIPKKRFEKMYFDWLENIQDWNISRQIVWGPRIPVWYKVNKNEQKIWVVFLTKNKEIKQGPIRQHFEAGFTLDEITQGIQRVYVPLYESEKNQPEIFVGKERPKKGQWIQETDTFDTWFLSGQWPLTALGYPDSPDFKYFYPTSVLDTLWDILFFWVGRMMMFGLHLAKDVPFKVIHIHARVVDEKGQKMSKSKFNVINPIEMVEKYGADALRIASVFGVAPGSDIFISEDKIRAMRNFANKVWNASRFILDHQSPTKNSSKTKHSDDKWILAETRKVVKQVTSHLNHYRFDLAADNIYQFFWHTFCDQYLEMTKKRRDEAQETLLEVLAISLKLLHPFMPFLTEQIWQLGKNQKFFSKEALIISQWPKI